MYNMTNVTDATNFLDMTKALNDVSGGYIGIFLLASLFFVMFIVFKRYEEDTKKVLLTCAILSTVLGIMLWGVGLIAWHIIIWPILLVFAFAIILKWG